MNIHEWHRCFYHSVLSHFLTRQIWWLWGLRPWLPSTWSTPVWWRSQDEVGRQKICFGIALRERFTKGAGDCQNTMKSRWLFKAVLRYIYIYMYVYIYACIIYMYLLAIFSIISGVFLLKDCFLSYKTGLKTEPWSWCMEWFFPWSKTD